MSHIAFVTPLFLGHLNPSCAIAGELAARGHAVTFLHMPDGEASLAARGFAYRPVGATTHPPGTFDALRRRVSGLNGPLGVAGLVREVAGVTDMLCRELPGALRAIQADMIVCDQVEAAGGLVAERLGLPHVSVASALPINWDAGVPPIFTPWRYGASTWARRRNLAGHHATAWVLRPVGEVIRGHAEAWSLRPRRRVDQCLSRLLQVAQLVPSLDYPRRRLPPVFHYCGAFRSPAETNAEAPLPPPDGRPLAYASLGSLQGSRERLFKTFARAAQECGLQLVLTHAGGLSPAQVARLPGAPAAYAFLPQPAVLRRASVAILHGGLNTVLDALAQGVPCCVVPVAFEQGAIAGRVAHAGAGVGVSRRLTTAGRLGAVLRRLLDEPGYAAAASRLRDDLAAAGGARRAADLIETLLRTGQPVVA